MWKAMVVAASVTTATLTWPTRPALAQDAATAPTVQPPAPVAIPAAPEPAPPPFPVAASVEEDVAQLTRQLLESPQLAVREEAARRLLQRTDPAARDAIILALRSLNNRDAQLAAARAIPTATRPDPAFENELFALLGMTRVLNEAAGTALGMYKDSPTAMRRLIDRTQPGTPDAVRITASRALGMIVDRNAAHALMMVLTNAAEPQPVRDAAADALVNMTGLSENGRSAARWFQWWQLNANTPPEEFRVRHLLQRSARFDRAELELDRLAEDAQAMMDQQVLLIPPNQKAHLLGPMLGRWLASSSPAIRAHAADTVGRQILAVWVAPPEIREQLRGMVGDSDPAVRMKVAGTIRLTRDPQAVEPLLVQLRQDTEPPVRRELVATLAKIEDLRAVPDLRRVLADDSTAVATAAAEALRALGPKLRDAEPRVAREVALELRDRLQSDPRARRNGGSGDFREAIVRSMVSMREPDVNATLTTLLGEQANESPEIRRAVIEAVGEMNEPQFAEMVVSRLDDPNESIRIAAAIALRRLARPAHAGQLYERLNPQAERSEKVRDEVWTVLVNTLFPEMNEDQLRRAIEVVHDRPERKVAAQQALATLYLKLRNDRDLAYERLNLGKTYMDLNQPGKAVAEYQAAYNYFADSGQGMATEQVRTRLLQALLADRKYADAAKFVAERKQEDASTEETLGPILAAKAEDLLKTQRYDDVLALVDEARNMKPQLLPMYMARLERSATEASQQRSTAPSPAAGG